MLEVLLAIRNNNMNKIPNYDPSFGEHLRKVINSHLHKGNYVSELKISMQDLLNGRSKKSICELDFLLKYQ
jgi:nucleolar MIF4G domain-containing protein 1